MDRYAMNRSDMRYRNQRPRICDTPSYPPVCTDSVINIYHHVDQMPLAMAYVPMQKYDVTYDPCKALMLGTAFPELCKPFCGKRGVRK